MERLGSFDASNPLTMPRVFDPHAPQELRHRISTGGRLAVLGAPSDGNLQLGFLQGSPSEP